MKPRSTKIIATLGPACDSVEGIRALIGAGMNVARLNFSHGDPERHRLIASRVREVSDELRANVAVMVDTKGPEIRTGELREDSVDLLPGETFTLYTDGREGDASGVSITHQSLPDEVSPGGSIYLDDGQLELRVVSVQAGAITTQVVRGGPLSSRKGVNVPGVALSLPVISAADRDDLALAAELEADYIAASFVRTAADVTAIRAAVRECGLEIPILAKIESAQSVDHLDEIIAAADGTMVARGDLGVELPVAEVPGVQKRIIRATVLAGKPVITATQMLDSMERSPRPTRAEASDVANAIFDGTSALMLSGETAMGRYPVESVETMSAIARAAERDIAIYGDLQRIHPEPGNLVTDAVAHASAQIAERANAAAILTLTESGYTSRAISKYRPACPILAISSSPRIVHRLALNWGVTGLLHDAAGDDEARIAFGLATARERFAKPGDVVVVTAGIARASGTTNLIRVVEA